MLKKTTKFLILMCIGICLYNTTIFASTNTTVRTEDNLQIDSSYPNTQKVINAALNTPKVDETEKVYDFANLLTQDQEETIYQLITQYIENYDMDMAVVTINTNNKNSAQEYADDFYDYNYFGIGSNKDGLLLLIDMDNRRVHISTTGRAISVYTDSKIDKILDQVQPNLSSSSYFQAVKSFISYSEYYVNNNVRENSNNTTTKTSMIEMFKIVAVAGAIASIIWALICVSKHRNVKKAQVAKYYLVNGSLVLSEKLDAFINSTTSKTRISSDSSGGGSSTHSGSSGTSHGGGGRSF